MNCDVEDFLNYVRGRSEFIEAAQRDPVWLEHVDNMENGLRFLYALGNDDPGALEAFDGVIETVTRPDMMLKQRLLGIVAIMERYKAESEADSLAKRN